MKATVLPAGAYASFGLFGWFDIAFGQFEWISPSCMGLFAKTCIVGQFGCQAARPHLLYATFTTAPNDGTQVP